MSEEFTDQREAYNTGIHDAVSYIKHYVGKYKLTTMDQLWCVMGELLENRQYQELQRQVAKALRAKDQATRAAQNDEQGAQPVVQNEREKEMEVSRLLLDQAGR